MHSSPGDDLFVGTEQGPSHLFRNEGNGNFLDATEQAGLLHQGRDLSAEWLDYDNDGRLDLNVSTETGAFLYLSLGTGLFESVSRRRSST